MKGSTLIEVLIAITIFSSALLGAGFLTVQSLKVTHQGLQLTKQLLQHTDESKQLL